MSGDQEAALWIMCTRAAAYGLGLSVVTCLVIALADRWWKR